MNTQTALLQFVEQFKKGHHGRSPSYREVVEAGICASKSGVHRHVQVLVKKGLLIQDGSHLELPKKPSSSGPYSLPQA